MEQVQRKGKTTFKVLSIIFTAIAFALLVLCMFFAIEMFTNLEEYRDPATNDLGTGLSMAFGLVFYIIFGVIDIPIIGLGISFSALATKRKSNTGLALLITNIAMIVALVSIFIIIQILI